MSTSEFSAVEFDVETQKAYWDYWNARTGYPHERALRRGDQIIRYLSSLGLCEPVILDMGCGMGWLAKLLAEHGPTTGIDISDDAIQHAKSTFDGVEFLSGNVLEMDLAEQHYDVVVSQEVVAHVPNQVEYVARAARALKPNGHLILTTPNRFVHDRVDWPDQPPGHIERWLTRKQLFQLLRPQFRILRWTTVVPLSGYGVLRMVHSAKLNGLARLLISAERLEAAKEWAGFGWTLVVLAQRH